MPHPNKYVKAGKYSLYAYGAKGNNLVGSAIYESVPNYLKRKFITRPTLRTLVKKGWIAVIRVKSRLWVHEVCPHEIDDYLS